ncbi:MAG TPA: hypothetical protein VFN74_20255 [Chloroflexota bacterium]|nr:hypothetical protein [Chloroflexota bacterium]
MEQHVVRPTKGAIVVQRGGDLYAGVRRRRPEGGGCRMLGDWDCDCGGDG